jgi:hypothetical protein
MTKPSESKMTREEQFRAELFDLLRRYKVEIDAAEEQRGCDLYVTGISFWSFAQCDDAGNEVGGKIDFTVCRRENGEE